MTTQLKQWLTDPPRAAQADAARTRARYKAAGGQVEYYRQQNIRYHLQEALAATTVRYREFRFRCAFERMTGKERAEAAQRAMDAAMPLPLCPVCLAETVVENQRVGSVYRLVVFCSRDGQHYHVAL